MVALLLSPPPPPPPPESSPPHAATPVPSATTRQLQNANQRRCKRSLLQGLSSAARDSTHAFSQTATVTPPLHALFPRASVVSAQCADSYHALRGGGAVSCAPAGLVVRRIVGRRVGP